MKKLIAACALAVLPCFAVSAEDCVEPMEPQSLPSGTTATRDEMRTGQEAMKAYNAAVTEYAACVDRNHLNPATANEAVKTLRNLANRFNAELRTFKAKSGG
jgi:opacity protein-like surface antigen